MGYPHLLNVPRSFSWIRTRYKAGFTSREYQSMISLCFDFKVMKWKVKPSKKFLWKITNFIMKDINLFRVTKLIICSKLINGSIQFSRILGVWSITSALYSGLVHYYIKNALIYYFNCNKVGCVFPMVIWSKFRMGQYSDDDHREDTPTLYYETN